MFHRPIHCRRARRTDAAAVFALFAGIEDAPSERDRGVRHRFRQVVADLGGDCYVAVVDEAVVGCVHVTYARPLEGPPRATVEALLVAEAHRDAAVVALADLVRERARRRGCRRLDWRGPGTSDATRAFAAHLGGRLADPQFAVEIPEADE